MADQRDYITHYVKYFNLKAPSSFVQAILFLLVGAASGSLSSMAILQQNFANNISQVVVSGISTGILVTSLPALLTVVLIKTTKRRMLLKHAMLATLLVTIVYALLLFINAFLFASTGHVIISYIMLVLSNACVYGYWFIVSKFVMGKRKSAGVIAAAHPVLNMLFYLPLGGYILNINVPLGATLIKLFAGMLVFLAVGYTFLYIVDRPVKRRLEVSGINIFTSMLSQWLYDITNDVKVVGYGAGARRDLEMDVLMLKGKEKYKGIFVNPDIHFGPFQGVGGSIAPQYIGDLLARKYCTVPVVLHAPLDIQDNPISTAQVYALSREIEKTINNTKPKDFNMARGSLTLGENNKCRAINFTIGDSSMILLTKAPYVTEDMSRDVGVHLRHFASDLGKKSTILVDAHNSRFESAGAKELGGVGLGSSYVRCYERAITDTVHKAGKAQTLSFGAAYSKLSAVIGYHKDLGEGYTSVCVFKFGSEKFCVVFFDANNMRPTFRTELLQHIRTKFKMRAEACTTDTHSINTVASTASMSLGRRTEVKELLPTIDSMIEKALGELEPVSYAYAKAKISNFFVWGERADALIENTSKEVKRILKYVAPLLVIFAITLAAWIIYVV